MMEAERFDRMRREAERLGEEYGRNAASWCGRENLSVEDARALVEDIDPEVEDRFAAPAPLSGEWADGLLVSDVLAEIGADDDGSSESEAFIDGFEDAYYQAFRAEIEVAARGVLNPSECVNPAHRVGYRSQTGPLTVTTGSTFPFLNPA